MDIYAEVTNRIMEQLEKGIIPWEKPWFGTDCAVSHATGKAYSLLNQMMLGMPDEYITFKQCADEGGRVKKGAKSKVVVFWTLIEKEDQETGEIKKIPYLRYSRVFALSDCEGISRKYTSQQHVSNNDPIEAAQNILDGYVSRENIRLANEGASAYYRPSDDSIHVPELGSFVSAEAYYDTAFHECVHSTGTEKRLNRSGICGEHSRSEYSKEELIAEIGSAYIMHRLGIETADTIDNNVAYLQSWLKALKNDKRMIVYAASAAAKAAEYVMTGQKGGE